MDVSIFQDLKFKKTEHIFTSNFSISKQILSSRSSIWHTYELHFFYSIVTLKFHCSTERVSPLIHLYHTGMGDASNTPCFLSFSFWTFLSPWQHSVVGKTNIANYRFAWRETFENPFNFPRSFCLPLEKEWIWKQNVCQLPHSSGFMQPLQLISCSHLPPGQWQLLFLDNATTSCKQIF